MPPDDRARCSIIRNFHEGFDDFRHDPPLPRGNHGFWPLRLHLYVSMAAPFEKNRSDSEYLLIYCELQGRNNRRVSAQQGDSPGTAHETARPSLKKYADVGVRVD